jgi:hypothetical protein
MEAHNLIRALEANQSSLLRINRVHIFLMRTMRTLRTKSRDHIKTTPKTMPRVRQTNVADKACFL